MFTIKSEHLYKLFEINNFPVSEHELVFFGLRGCLPVNEDDNTFQQAVTLSLGDIDYKYLRCTLIQWNVNDDTIAAFPASTVPHEKHVTSSLHNEGKGTNRLMTGKYKDYRKGYHKAGSPTGHEAFRQDNKLPIRRSADDLDYDEEDRVEFVRPFDNIHASWCPGVNHPRYASAGCQVIMGYPKCERRGESSEHTGPWKIFHDNAYSIAQKSFDYILLNGRDARKVAIQPDASFTPRLRYGSQGSLVGKIQKALAAKNYYEGNIDNDFGSRTLFAVLDFQTNEFGSDGDDGIVGPMTAQSLNIKWL